MSHIHRTPSVATLVSLAFTLTLPQVARAQGTAADYARAESVRSRLDGLVIDAVDTTGWVGNTSRFWYRKSVKGGTTFMLADAATLQKKPAFDHAAIAASLSTVLGRPISALRLPFASPQFSLDVSTFDVQVDSTRLTCTVAASRCVRAELGGGRGGRGGGGGGRFGGGLYGDRPQPAAEPRVSPDGKTEASIRNFNVFTRAVGTQAWMPLSSDGSEANAYNLQSLSWSPDSKTLAAYRVKPGYRREVHYVQSSPEDQIQPKDVRRLYNKPGDVLDMAQPVLFDLATRAQTEISNALFPNAYDVTGLAWRADSRALTFEYNQRGHQAYRVIEIDGRTGATRAIINEETPTFFEYSAKKYRFDLNDGAETVWMSERDGWNHLYLYDGRTGQVKNQITRGAWLVRGVDRVDPESRQVWFRASGMYAGKDPYFVHSYRINLDGSGLTTFTEADANHAVRFSGDGQYYLDRYSRVDLPPVLELRRTERPEARDDRREGRRDGPAGHGLEAARGVRVEGTRWQDRHLRRDRASRRTSTRSGSIRSSSTSTPARTTRSCPSRGACSTACRRRPSWGSSCRRSTAWGPPTARRRSTMWRGRTSATPASPIASCGTRRWRPSIRGTTPRKWASTAARPAARTPWGAALPPRVLQGGGEPRRLPRQPHGQDLVERAVDGMAHRGALRRRRPTW